MTWWALDGLTRFPMWSPCLIYLSLRPRKNEDLRNPDASLSRTELGISTSHKWVCLKMLCAPLYPMVLLIIIPFLNGYFMRIYTIFRQTQIKGYPQCPKSKKFKQIPVVTIPLWCLLILIDPLQTQPSLVFKQTHTHTYTHTIIKGFTGLLDIMSM